MNDQPYRILNKLLLARHLSSFDVGLQYNSCYTQDVTKEQKDHTREWYILVYKLPSEPTRYRASVWRKLRAAGAIYLQNGVAALPDDPGSKRVMRGIVQEIREAEGMAHLLRGEMVGDEAELVRAFGEARDAEYREVLDRCREFHVELEKERKAGKFTFAELEENEEDLAKLQAWLGKIRARDRFGAPLSQAAEQEVLSCRDDLEAFAESVYEAADSDSADISAS
jgi:hypothetical protein